MPSSTHTVTVADCCTPQHAADLAALKLRHRAIPHEYGSWPWHCNEGSWLWCRVTDRDGELVTGFAVNLTDSLALPHTRIGRIERLGRDLHEEVSDAMGSILIQVAHSIPRLLRLDVRVFDENPMRRQRLEHSLATAGWTLLEHQRSYSHTLVLALGCSEAEVRKSFTSRARSSMRKALETPLLRYGAIGATYAERLRELHTLTFERTGAPPPLLDVEAILRDSQDAQSSYLIGAFATDRAPPEDLVAFAWTRLHGDHGVLEITASERSALFRKLSPGFGLMAHLVAWALEHGLRWMDLGGLSTLDPAPTDPLRGIVEFKTRFSRDFREVASEWRLEPHPMLARAAAAMRSIRNSVNSSTSRRP
ncbi:MAG TPA: GNAT family N-acetyltransferase [Steroidobacteraceae bacterium]